MRDYHGNDSCNQSWRSFSFDLDASWQDWRVLQNFQDTAFSPATPYSTCLYPNSNLDFYMLSSVECIVLWNVWHEMRWEYWSGFSLEHSKRCCLSLLTVDNHIDIFDIRRGDVVAGLAFITTRLVSHDTYNVQVLFSVQRLCCREIEREKERRWDEDKVNV